MRGKKVGGKRWRRWAGEREEEEEGNRAAVLFFFLMISHTLFYLITKVNLQGVCLVIQMGKLRLSVPVLNNGFFSYTGSWELQYHSVSRTPASIKKEGNQAYQTHRCL
jgi:hypothetical protein